MIKSQLAGREGRPKRNLLKIATVTLPMFLALWGCAIGHSPVNAPPTWRDKIENRAKVELTQTGLPSLQIAIGLQGELIYENAVGFSDKANRARATTDTQYRTASISKWLTGTATFKLVDSGKLDIDAPIQTYCPQYPAKNEVITTRHLLSHTSGIRHYSDFEAMRAQANTEADKASVEAWIAKNMQADRTRFTDTLAPLEVFKDDPLLFTPGTQFQYSSFGYRVLGCVITGAAGKPYRGFMASKLFDPVGMSQTVPEDTANIPETRATLYDLQTDGTLQPAASYNISANLPAGGHISTASNLIRFTNAFGRGELISDASRGIMASEPIRADGQTMKIGYGHGVDFMGDFPGSLGHGGRQAGTTTLLIYLPDYDVSVAVMTNASGWGGITPFVADILAILQAHVSEL